LTPSLELSTLARSAGVSASFRLTRMNLRDQLKEILPEILPSDPASSIKGTELIRLVKYRLRQEYSDATLRYHFSILCADPSSPIAKVDQGQGYYLRTTRVATLEEARALAAAGFTQAGMDLFQSGREMVDLARSRMAKMRALYLRAAAADARFPFALAPSPSPEGLWKYPDVAVVDWELEDAGETGFRLEGDLLELKRSLGVQPFAVTSVRLAMAASYDNVRELFFQALSGSRWAHTGELVIGAAITDEQLAEDLRRLGGEYGIGVSTLGVQLEALDDIVDAASIARMEDRAFENLQGRLLARQKITSARPSATLDWRQIRDMRREHADFHAFFAWIEQCLRDGTASPHAAAEVVPSGLSLAAVRGLGLPG
jgi:hypothetical protein